MIRFTFLSDGKREKRDGWLIDNITIYLYFNWAGVEEYSTYTLNDIQLFPNPSKDFLHVKCDINLNKTPEIFVYNIHGVIQKVEYKNLGKEIVINTSCLKSGLYYFIIKDNDNNFKAKKFIVE